MKPIIALLLLTAYSHINAQQLDWASATGAKKFPQATKEFNVNKYGAKGDGKTMNTRFIQRAIDACAKSGGGIVSFSAGSYVTGAIYLKENVHLRIDREVLLLGSENVQDYPEIDTRIAGIEMKWPSAMINVLNVNNAAISGKGTVLF